MRRAKPKEKREIKINEKKEIPVIRDIQIPKELENAFVFTACMLEMKACLEEHREIWRKEFKNGGYLKANYKIALGRMINLCDMLSKKYTENGIKMTDFARIKIIDRKSTRLNSSHANISYAVFCLKKKITP